MLNLDTLMSTRDLVNQLGTSKELYALPNTPIAEAIAATRLRGVSATTTEDIDQLPDALYSLNEVRLENGAALPDLHSSYIEETSARIGSVIAAHVDYTLNVVGVAVKELNDRIIERLDTTPNPNKAYNIIPTAGSSLFDEPSFVNEIEKYKNVPADKDVDLVLDYKDVSHDELVRLMKVGGGNFDVAVDEFVKEVGMEFLDKVWKVVFQSDKGVYSTYNSFRVSCGVNANIAVFLLSSKLIQDEGVIFNVTGASGLSASRYVFFLKDLQEISGCALAAHLEAKNKEITSGRLINRIDGKTIYVNKPVYDKYLEEGGDVEVILGSVLNGNKAFYVQDLMNERERFTHAWNHNVALEKANYDENSLGTTKSVINSFVREYILNSNEEIIKNNSEKIISLAIEYANEIDKFSLVNINQLATNVVCKTIFAHTDAHVILTKINIRMDEDKEMSANEALTVSLVEYVADWYTSQLRLEK